MKNIKISYLACANLCKVLCFFSIFLLSGISQVANASEYNQLKKFSFELNNVSVRAVLKYIEKDSEFVFLYNENAVNGMRQITVKVEKQTIDKVLEQVFANLPVNYEIKGRQILLKESKVIPVPEQAKGKKLIQGFVKDERGDAVIGATIRVKDTTIGTTTNIDGLYNLSVPSENSILVITYIGYVTQEIKVGNRQNIIITLKEYAKALEEVVVTAYGTGQKKVSVVGSVQTVRPSDLKVPSSNLSTSFAGRLAGVIAVQRGGEPGADGASFWIRGASTFSSTSPLIIIDGVESSSADLNALDPEVIDGFSILKDATATAMYGMRGANGVMIVNTKSGANLDKPIINFRMEASMNEPTSIPKFVDGVEFMELFNEAVYNQSSGKVAYPQEKIDATRQGLNPYIFPNVNWYDEVFKDRSYAQTFNFNIRGGGKRVDYFSSVSISHEDGMLKSRSKDFFSFDNNINRMRYSFQNNVNAKFSSTSKLSLRLNVQMIDKRQPRQAVKDVFSQVMYASPVDFPVMFPDDGETPYVKWGANPISPTTNPVAYLATNYTDVFESTVTAALDFEQNLKFILPGLKFKAMASMKVYNKSIQSRYSDYNTYSLENWTQNEDGTYDFVVGRIGSEKNTALKAASANEGDRRIYLQAMFDYSRTFGKHDVNAMFIYNQDEYVVNNPGSDLLKALPKRRQGIAARASYMFDGRYMAEVNLGYNGSENFAAGHRFGLFPSFAIGYNISEEKFFKPLQKVITNMKIRASYGLVGNGDIGQTRFAYQSSINLTGSPSFTTGKNQELSLSGPVYNRFANNDLTWEVGKKYNVGLDLTLLRSLNLTVDLFREDRTNIFQEKVNIPYYAGVYGTKVFTNYAEVRNQGVDASIDLGHQFNKNLSMTFKGTFTYAHNEVMKYDESIGNYIGRSKVGHSISQPFGYVSDNLFADQAEIDAHPQQLLGGIIGPGDIKYMNMPDKYGNYDGVIDHNDQVAIGNPTTPEIVYGFGPSIKWKGFDFSFFFQGVAKTSLMMQGIQPFGSTLNSNVRTFIAEDRWSPDNQNIRARYPRLTAVGQWNNAAGSTYWLRDGAFLKLKNMEIGYTYKFMRFYLRGSNLLTFSKFDLWDPEQGGGSGLKYPTQRVFNVGFQMTIK